MRTHDHGAPLSGADELKRLAEAERASERAKQERAAAAAAREARRDAKRSLSAREKDARVPGFGAQPRFELLKVAFIGLVLLGAIGPLVPDVGLHRAWYAACALWALLLTLALVDALTWRRRLPFSLIEPDRLTGHPDSRDDYSTWIEVGVSVVLRDGSTPPALATALELLVTRLNRLMGEDQDFSGALAWRSRAPNAVGGHVDHRFFSARVLEKWLRREVRLLHGAHPVERVETTLGWSQHTQRLETPSMP